MNITLIKEEIAIARQQAGISKSKEVAAQKEYDAYKQKYLLERATMYRIRAAALNMYAYEQIKKLKKHNKVQYKKDNDPKY